MSGDGAIESTAGKQICGERSWRGKKKKKKIRHEDRDRVKETLSQKQYLYRVLCKVSINKTAKPITLLLALQLQAKFPVTCAYR